MRSQCVALFAAAAGELTTLTNWNLLSRALCCSLTSRTSVVRLFRDVHFVLGSIWATRANLSLLQTSGDADELGARQQCETTTACVCVGLEVCACVCLLAYSWTVLVKLYANSKSFIWRYLLFVLFLSLPLSLSFLFVICSHYQLNCLLNLNWFPFIWFVIMFYFGFLLWFIIVFYYRFPFYSFLFCFSSCLCFSIPFSWFALAIRQQLRQMSCIMRNARAISKCLQIVWEGNE